MRPIIVSLVLAVASTARAVYVDVVATGGVMTQPTSNYYHFVYGGIAEAGLESQALMFRAGYLERPAFKAAGFIDQEFCGFAMIGTKVFARGGDGVVSFIGWGEMTGTIERDVDAGVPSDKRRYKLPGPTLSLAYRWRLKNLSASIGHQTLIGFADKAQTEARVAWPFNFLLLDVGWMW